MPRKPPPQKPWRSETIVRTPPEFLQAVRNYLEIEDFSIDLAASKNNAVCSNYFTVEDNALEQYWWDFVVNGVFKLFHNKFERARRSWAWLNPPYDRIEPWVRRAHEQSLLGLRVAVLVPAAIGTRWWRKWVFRKAHVLIITPRLCFLDKNGKPIISKKTGKPASYPKDLALLLYGVWSEPDIEYFDWKEWL